MKSLLSMRARVARSLVTVLILSIIQIVIVPITFHELASESANAETLDTNGMIIDWELNNPSSYFGSGTTITDLRGNSNGIVTNGATFTSSGGGYFTLVGSSSHFISTSSDFTSALDATNSTTKKNLSVFTWVYLTGNGVIVDEVDTSDNSPNWYTSMIELVGGTLKFRIYNSSTLTSSIATPLNNWYYVGVTYDAVNSTLTGYVNGLVAASSTGIVRAAPFEYGRANRLSIGRNDGTNLGDGTFGDFRFGALHVYKTPVSSSVVLNNFNATALRFGPTVSSAASVTQFSNRAAIISSSGCTNTTSGSSTCTYQWQLSTDGGNSFTNISGASTTSYTTPILTASDNGNMYRLKAIDPGTGSSTANDLFNYSTTATLTVSVMPGSDTDTALYFDGTDYVKVADSNEVDFTNAFTFQAWVKPETMTSYGMILNKEDSIEFYISGGYYGIAAQKALNQWGYFQTGVPAVVGEWHHIAYTRAANSTTVSVYLDGYLAWSGVIDTDFTSTPLNTSYPLMIGGRSGSASGVTFDPSFKGMIDHVAVYSAVRTQSQIQSDMKSYIAPEATDLLLYYDFNEGTGTTLYNRKSGSTSASDLLFASTSPTWTDVKEVSTPANSPYTIVKFPRTYITVNGGWRVPANVTRVTALVIAGGGAGGSRVGGGGGAGGYVYSGVLNLTSNSIETITVGQGGIGTPDYAGKNGFDSLLGSRLIAIGGGGGGTSNSNGERTGRAGGSGGGSGDSSGSAGASTQALSGTSTGLGNAGANGEGGGNWSAGGGGGATAAGFNGTNATYPGWGGTGKIESITGTAVCYAAGGGGGIYGASGTGASRNNGGRCAGLIATGGSGTISNTIGLNAIANTGSGGGGAGYLDNNVGSDKAGGNGGSGVIIIRWITALAPSYTKPTIAYLNVGMTETFTTTVAQDSATVVLTRTFKWESTTPSANGAYTLIKQGTGAANAAFSWVPSDTTTSGTGYLYRLTVTDSDTAGLFITDSSTAYAVINRALVVSGTSSFGKTINLAKSETFTITLGTPTYRASLSPTIAGITLDTSTAGSAVIKISETMTVGTYYETLTVTDSVSASVVTPLTIVVAAPPNLVNTSEIVDNGLIFNLDFANSASFNRSTGAISDISGSKKVVTSNGGKTFSEENLGYLKLNSASSQYLAATGFTTLPTWTIDTFIRLDSTSQYACIVTGERAVSSSTQNLALCVDATTPRIYAGFHNGTSWTYVRTSETITLNTWTHIAAEWDGLTNNATTSVKIWINGVRATNFQWYTAATSPSAASSNRIFINHDPVTGNSSYTDMSIGYVRIYNRALSETEVGQNFNATKNRFLSQNVDLATPSYKYGNTTTETFTTTSGYGSDTFSFAVGSKAGVMLETTTSVVTLKMQESLTATTHYETITVSDSLGASTYLPIKMTVSKADTLTISMDTKTVVTFNGSPITSYPKPVIRGLAGLDTFTVTTKFSSSLYTKSATVPTNSDTYTVIAEDPVFGIGALSNYVNVVYETSTAIVNKAKQPALSVFLYGGTVGQGFPITVSGGGGDGAITESVTAGSTMTGCSISNHVLTATSTSQGFCRVYIVKALSQNYLSESITVDMYFMAYINNQPTGLVGSGSTIALNGATSLTIDDTTTVRAPNITSLSTTSGAVGSVIHIYGGNFGAGPVTVKFNRNKSASGTVVSGNDITVTVPTGALTGTILVIAAGGEAYTPTFTVLP